MQINKHKIQYGYKNEPVSLLDNFPGLNIEVVIIIYIF